MALAERPTRTTQQTTQTERAALTSRQGRAGELLTAYLAVQVADTLHLCTLEWRGSDPPALIDVGLEPDPQPGGHVSYVRALRRVARVLWRQEQAARHSSNVWAARRWKAGADRLAYYLDEYQAAAWSDVDDEEPAGPAAGPGCDAEAVAYG